MPLVEGRNMIMILSPLAKKHARGTAEKPAAPAGEREEAEKADSGAARVPAPQAAEQSSNGSSSRNDAEDQNP
jgi:hypothetical protein